MELWERHSDILAHSCGIREPLLSLDPVLEAYGMPAEAGDNPRLAAHYKAHHRMFEKLDFFAVTARGEFLAFYRTEGYSGNPPVAKLDSEGQYGWAGADLADALYWAAEDEGSDLTGWLKDQGFACPEGFVLGASTQFLPGIDKWHLRFYREWLGELVRKDEDSPSGEPDAYDPSTWLGHKGEAVRDLIARAHGEDELRKYWVSCDARGFVHSARVLKPSLGVAGITLGCSREELLRTSGEPTQSGAIRLYYDKGPIRLHFTIQDERIVKMMCMTIDDSQ